MDDLDTAVIERAVEAIIFAAADPVSMRDLQRHLPEGADVRKALDALTERYETQGVNLRRVGDAYAFRTAPDMAGYLQNHVVSERKLSRAAIETLAIIAYHQPTTRAEIEEIRSVAVSKGTLDQLLSLEWIRLGKRRETPGRPVTFLTTTEFLDHFGLASPRDLPGLAELRAAGLLERSPLDEVETTEAKSSLSELEFEDQSDDIGFVDDEVIDENDY